MQCIRNSTCFNLCACTECCSEGAARASIMVRTCARKRSRSAAMSRSRASQSVLLSRNSRARTVYASLTRRSSTAASSGDASRRAAGDGARGAPRAAAGAAAADRIERGAELYCRCSNRSAWVWCVCCQHCLPRRWLRELQPPALFAATARRRANLIACPTPANPAKRPPPGPGVKNAKYLHRYLSR